MAIKKKEKRSLRKVQMKNKSLQLKSEKNRNIDIFIEMDFHNTEVSGMDCDLCRSNFLCQECSWCPNSHKICLKCMKLVITDTLKNKKLQLACPIAACPTAQAIFHPDLLSKMIDPFIFEIVSMMLQERLAVNVKKISCPQCHFLQVLDYEEEIHFKCKNCSLEFCSYCLQSWSSICHNECRLLNYSGQFKCFRNLYDELPANWRTSAPVLSGNDTATVAVETASDVDLNSNEGRTVIQLFCKTLPGIQVTAISRLQNIKLWGKYVLKRKHMIEEIGLANIKERALFHGTKSENIPSICKNGFNKRAEKVNGDRFGKGIYFSTSASYSNRYAAFSNKMFIARALCGYSTIGLKGIIYPPDDVARDRAYDSCVDDLNKPNIYCLFDNNQCYPAYVVSYK
uniref:Poly [ADP-ribose] polymerase n=1 Tax=Biomphalaria glabrata TaxID=6526 RepID=A0A2C9LSX5_BIOGL